ncbi:Toxin RelG [Oligella sp. MSHR50489EDL]|uniref:type II toxin-antitoxin system RelE family toxin n=1 Tax=Oligella TaxID=90243 RepID=UPI000CFFD13F|nr:type II toxin-antitoxin system RelE/ParE family toxin [Oligella urethralis]AVL70642.1 type II toxin-antitoxin system mRNA interferase toxin, RelE/StbE family [Oligella urethralis]
MAYKIFYSDKAKKELSKLDKPVAKRIHNFLIERVIQNPKQQGGFLKGTLAEFWRYRVGDYRIIAQIDEDILTVLVIRIAHRKDVYDKY